METTSSNKTNSSSLITSGQSDAMADGNFPNFVPDFRSLQLSAQHRLQNSSNRKCECSAISQRSLTSQSKTVKRRICKSAASSIFTETTESDGDTKSVMTELDVTPEDVQHLEGAMLDETDELGALIFSKEEDDISQKRYRSACRTLKVIPTARILNSLTTNELNLKNHVIGERGAHACAVALMVNGTVEKLDLEGNALGPNGTWYICKMLKENIFITDLSLAMNNLGTKGLHYMTDAMTTMDTIKKLNLSANGLKDDDAVYIAEIIKESVSLEELSLSYNEFREKGGEIIAEALAKNSCLEILDLSWNHLRLSGAEAIAECIGRNNTLKVLNLGWNGFHLEGCKQFAASLEINESLENLDLTCNRVNVTCLEYLLKGLRKNTTITHLTLARNPLSSDGALSILDMLLDTPQSPMTYINIHGQDVCQTFMRRLEAVREMRGESLTVIYGLAMHEDQIKIIEQEESAFIKQDPVTILMEYIRLKNLRLVDLFRKLDDDNSNSISKEEFKRGLMSSGIPVTEAMLERIISKLDINKNGEIEYNELITGQREHKRKVNKLLETAAMANIPFEQTELGSISEKLRHVMKIREYFWPNKFKRWKNAIGQTTHSTSRSNSPQTNFKMKMTDEESQTPREAKKAIVEESLTYKKHSSDDVSGDGMHHLFETMTNVSSA